MKLHHIIAVMCLLAGTLGCQLTAPLIVSGTVADADGVPPAAALIILLSQDDYTLSALTTTDADGHYQLEAPGDQDHLLFVNPLSGKTAEGYNLHGHAPQLTHLPAGSGHMIRDFILVPCHDFILESYDADGSLILNDDWIGIRFADDFYGNTTDDLFISIDKGEGTPAVPSVCIPLGQTRRFFTQWTLPNFGSIVLMGDNDGSGYSADAGGGTVLNLSHELARTQVNRLRNKLNVSRQS